MKYMLNIYFLRNLIQMNIQIIWNINRKQFQVIQTTTIETLPCETHNARPFVCVKSPGCGWCQRRKRCIHGDEYGPTQNNACSFYDNYVFDVPKGFIHKNKKSSIILFKFLQGIGIHILIIAMYIGIQEKGKPRPRVIFKEIQLLTLKFPFQG